MAKNPGHVCNYGEDKHAYLGHFRDEKHVKSGHNSFIGGGKPNRIKRVAKSGVDVNAVTNPVLAAKVDRKKDVMAAKQSGVQGAVKAARTAGTADVMGAKQTRAAFTPKDEKTQSSALKSTLMGARNALAASRKGVGTAMRGRRKF